MNRSGSLVYALVAVFATTSMISNRHSSLLYLLWLSFFFIAILLYLPSYFDQSSKTGERYWPRTSKLSQRSYVPFSRPMEIVYETPLNPSKQYIVTSHPHGIASVHHWNLMTGRSTPSFNEAVPPETRRHVAASVVFKIPILRDILLWCGCIDAGREIAEKALQEGKSLVVLTGGMKEQVMTKPNQHLIVIKGRKGLIRLAIKYGVPIVPGYNFDENNLYDTYEWFLPLRQWIAQYLRFAIVFASGPNRLLPFVPRNLNMHQVFAAPIPVVQEDEPSKEQTDRIHKEYVISMKRIFNENKEKFGYKDAELIIA